MTLSTHLAAARALIDEPKRWIKGEYDCVIDSNKCFCAEGAMLEVLQGENLIEMAIKALTVFEAVIDGMVITLWNDAPERTHADVMAAFDRAIELARREGV